MAESEMVVRVARALVYSGHLGSSIAFTEAGPHEDSLSAYFRSADTAKALAAARAAIKAMGEPTEEMLASGVSALPNEEGVSASRHEADHVWQAMISAALGQEGTEG